MAEASTFANVIGFMQDLGVYDVVLPFMLIFTIVFAILEKTKVLGMDEIDGKKYTKKNLNAMVAFVLAFLVVASSRLVALVNEAMANMVMLLLLSISFLLLIGSFYREGEDVFLEGGWRTTFMVIMFVGIILIFMNAIKVGDDKKSFLIWLWNDFIIQNWGTAWLPALILIIFVILIMVLITRDPKPVKTKKDE